MHSAIEIHGNTSHSSESADPRGALVFPELPSSGLNSRPKLNANLESRASNFALAVYLRELATAYAMVLADRGQS